MKEKTSRFSCKSVTFFPLRPVFLLRNTKTRKKNRGWASIPLGISLTRRRTCGGPGFIWNLLDVLYTSLSSVSLLCTLLAVYTFHTNPSKGMCGYVSSRPVLRSDLRLATAGKSHAGLAVRVSILQQQAVVAFMTSRIGTRITSETAVELS